MENIILVSSMILGVVVYGLIAKWYIVPALDMHSRSTALVPLSLLHCFRYLGLSFLLPGVVSADIAPGTLDLLNAFPQALLNIHAGQLGGAYLIPSLIVPALLVSHVLVFRLLIKRAGA